MITDKVASAHDACADKDNKDFKGSREREPVSLLSLSSLIRR